METKSSVPLGEICDIFDHLRKPVTRKNRVNGDYPYYGASGVQDYVNDFIFDGRYILVGEDGAKWGSKDKSAFIVEGKCWINNHAHVLQPKQNFLDDYIVYYLNHLDLNKYITGAVIPKLTQSALRGIPIPILSIEKQKKLVGDVHLFEEILDKKTAQLMELDRLAQATYYDMFGDPFINEKKITKQLLGTIAKFKGGFAFKSSDYIKDGIRLVQISNVNKDNLDWGVVNYLPLNFCEEYSEYNLQEGDLVMAMTRPIIKSLEAVKIAIVKKEDLPCLLNQRVGKFEVDSFKINRKYLEYFCKQNYMKEKINSYCSTSLQPNISSKQVESIEILVPDLQHQEIFAEKIEAIEKQKELIKKSIDDVQQLFDYTMDKYFS